jgi:hypothetical protein
MTPTQSEMVLKATTSLARHGIEAGFVVPTATGLNKGIMDATWPLREFLSRTGIHSFQDQGKGPESKRVIPVRMIYDNSERATEMSLYRPETKDGDPRIWVYGLNRHAMPEDVIAVIKGRDGVCAINCSYPGFETDLANPATILGKLVAALDPTSSVAPELLEKLRALGRMGPVPSKRPGDTGIGFTLETLLGISANSNRAPDFHGIELKSGRIGKGAKVSNGRHITLFSKTPAWDQSPFSARRALEVYGYRDMSTSRLQLFCSIDAKRRNSLGFILEPRPATNQLVNNHSTPVHPKTDVFLWLIDELTKTFQAKHRETFWVGAQRSEVNGLEYFHFVEARHTRGPSVAAFEQLLASGGICVDLTMSERGIRAVRDHGYLFRVYGSAFDSLFPEVGTYSLVD